MKEVGKEGDVEPGAVLDRERVAAQPAMTGADTRQGRILGGHREDRRPVESDDLGRRIALGNGDAEDPVAGGDVQHADRTGGLDLQNVGNRVRRRHHQRRHRPREIHPDRIVIRHGIVGGSDLPASNRLGEPGEALDRVG